MAWDGYVYRAPSDLCWNIWKVERATGHQATCGLHRPRVHIRTQLILSFWPSWTMYLATVTGPKRSVSLCLGLLGAWRNLWFHPAVLAMRLPLNSATVYSKTTGSRLNKLPQHGKNAAGRNFNLGLVFFNDSSLQWHFKKGNQSVLVLLCCMHPTPSENR